MLKEGLSGDALHRIGHHLWNAERDDAGRVKVRRSEKEREVFDTDQEPKQAMRRVASRMSKEAMAETAQAQWGLFGADLVDEPTLNEQIPVSMSRRFNAASRNEAPPKIYSWDELRTAFTSEAVDFARKAIAHGMKVRFASKYLDVPFIVAAEILTQLPDTNREEVKACIDDIKAGRKVEAFRKQGAMARRVAMILDEFAEPVSHRIAVDKACRDYMIQYWGPFGEEMVREIKKRVKADLIEVFLHRQGVDQAAAKYWSEFMSGYGKQWVTIVPKKLSPSKK